MSTEHLVAIPLAINPLWGGQVLHKVDEEWFESELCRDIFAATKAIAANSEDSSTASLYARLSSATKDELTLDEFSDIISEPLYTDISEASWRHSFEEWMLSNLTSEFEDELYLLTEPGSNIALDEKLGGISGLIDKYQNLSRTDGVNSVDFSSALQETLVKMQEQSERGTDMVGSPTGFEALDESTLGFEPGALIIVAGRPSMGKTTLAMNICEHMALSGQRVKIHSLEMPRDQLVRRSLASIGSIPLQALRSSRLNTEESRRLSEASLKTAKMEMVIDDRGGLDIDHLCAQAKIEHKEKPYGALMVDYLQLLQCRGAKSSRSEEISEISRKLKGLAKELSCPVIALSQLNRSLEQRPDKRPIMSDLRESGQIEQDADIILFVYRDEVYNPTTNDKGIGEIIIGKQRNGSLGTIYVKFEGAYTRYRDMPKAPPMPIPGGIEKPDDGDGF